MKNASFKHAEWLGFLLGLSVACDSQVRSLGNDGTVGGGSAMSTGGALNSSAGADGGSAGDATTSTATGSALQATGGVAGGTAQTTGGLAEGGRGQDGSLAGTAGTTSSVAAGTGGSAGAVVTASCAAYNGTAGALLTPPSTSFELELGAWTMVSAKTSGVSRKQGTADACAGSSYLVCDGTSRVAGWDGPAIDLLPYVVAEHMYTATLAARFDPANARTGSAAITFTVAMMCTDPSIAVEYTRLQDLEPSPSSTWTRFSGTFKAKLAGCSQLSKLSVYLSTDDIDQALSLDVDDFQIWDVTPATGP